MRFVVFAAAVLAAGAAVPAVAQDVPASNTTSAADTSAARAPDGSRPFGLEPYVGISGGWEQFDNERNRAGVPQVLNANGTVRRNYKLAGALVEGVAGFNIPLGPVFVGAEGNVAKGVSGDIDWEYGGAGRFGFRAGDSGLFYGKVGYEWVNFDRFGNNSRDYHDMLYGIGFEVGPKDIGLGGLTQRAGFRLKGEVSTFGDAHSIRPTLGIVTHF
jgi:outer membrane immunogenic protein